MHGLFEKNAGKPITFGTLLPIFKGQSVNTAGFLLAVLKHQGLVRPIADSPRCYERADAKAFFAEVKALIGGPAVKPAKAVKAAKVNAASSSGAYSDKAKAATPGKAKPAKPSVPKR